MIRLLAFIICCLFSLSQASSQDDCRKFVESIWSQRSSPRPKTPEQRAYFENSGVTGVYDLGERAKCEENELTRYYILARIMDIVNSTHGAFVQSETGICVPTYCTKEVLMADRQMLQKIFKTNKWNIPATAKVTVYDINEAPPRGAGFILFMLLISFLAALGIFSTVMIYKKKKNSQEKANTQVTRLKSRIAILLDKCFWVFKAFDLRENGKGLYQTAKEAGQSEQISTFGLVRCFASIWIILSHTRHAFVHRKPYQTPKDETTEEFMTLGILGVEYFLFLGGFLAAYTLIGKALREGVGIRRYFSDIFHRLVRIWPPLFFAIIFYWVAIPGLINGPLMGRFVGSVKVCDQIWWNKLLMIDNYFPYLPWSGCLGVTWYLDVDFQVYFALVLIVFLYAKKKYLGYLVAFGFMVFSIYYSINRFEYGIERGSIIAFWYQHALARAYEVVLGVILGFQYYEYVKEKSQKNFFALCEKYADLRYPLIAFGLYLNWFAALPWEDVVVVNPINYIHWETVRRIAICLGTAFVFLPLANGTISFIRILMNLRIFQIIGKLNFGIYLLHFPIMLAVTYTQDHYPEEYDQSLVLLNSLKVVLITTAVSIPYYLLFEKPIMNIESHFTKRSKTSQANTTAKVQDQQDSNQPNQQKQQAAKDNFKDTPGVMIEVASVSVSLEQSSQMPILAQIDHNLTLVEVGPQEGPAHTEASASAQVEANLSVRERSTPSTSPRPGSL